MLKIKFNINEFTIIFLRSIEGKNECKRISFSLYQLQRLLYASVPLSLLLLSSLVSSPFFFFSFLLWSVRPFFFSSASLLFSLDVLPFFSPSVEPKTFFSSAQHISFFLFCSVFSAPFSFQFSASFCCFCSTPLSLVFSASFLLFCRHVALLSSAFYFLAQNRFEPKAQNVLLF